MILVANRIVMIHVLSILGVSRRVQGAMFSFEGPRFPVFAALGNIGAKPGTVRLKWGQRAVER